MGVWHQKLKDSQTINADALKSNVFQEIFESSKLDHESHDSNMGLLQRIQSQVRTSKGSLSGTLTKVVNQAHGASGEARS